MIVVRHGSDPMLESCCQRPAGRAPGLDHHLDPLGVHLGDDLLRALDFRSGGLRRQPWARRSAAIGDSWPRSISRLTTRSSSPAPMRERCPTGAAYGRSAAWKRPGFRPQQDIVDALCRVLRDRAGLPEPCSPPVRPSTPIERRGPLSTSPTRPSARWMISPRPMPIAPGRRFLSRPRTVSVRTIRPSVIADQDQPKLDCTATRTLDATVYSDPVQVGTDPETGEPIIDMCAGYEAGWTLGAGHRRPVSRRSIERLMDGFCRSTTTCTVIQMPRTASSHWRELSGSRLVDTALFRAYQQRALGAVLPASVRPACRSVSPSTAPAWTKVDRLLRPDPDGVEHCPEALATRTTATLAADPNCKELTIMRRGHRNIRVCYVDQVVYDCGTDQEIAGIERTSELDCGGEIRCLGDDCVAIEPEHRTTSTRRSPRSHAAEMVLPRWRLHAGSCSGLHRRPRCTCKRAVGGIVNCCDRPSGHLPRPPICN